MSATNPVILPDIAFSKNQLDLVLQSDDYLVAGAEFSKNFLQFTGPVAADTSFGLDWQTGSATMTAKVDPDDSGLQFPTGDGGEDYVTSLLDFFTGNYFLDRDFHIETDFTGDHPQLVFTARIASPDYDFINLNGGATGVITEGVTDEPRTNFSHHLQLWLSDPDNSKFIMAFSANIPLDFPVTGQSTIDIHEALHAFLSNDRPELDSLYSFYKNSIRRYFFKYGQIYGDPQSIRKLKKSGIYSIALGGLSKEQALLRNIKTELCPVDGHPEQNRFLRQGSINKMVAPDQPEWLTWINFTADEVSVSLEVKVYYSDDTSATATPVAGLAVGAYKKIQFVAGYQQLDIASITPEKAPKYYTIRVISGANALSQTYGFVIDNQYREWPRYFVYQNSYGAFQTIATVGKGQTSFDRIKDDAQMAMTPNQAALEGDFIEINILIQENGLVNTGYDRSSPRNIALLRDLMVSRKNFLWDNSRLVPIGFNTKSLKDAADGVNIYGSSIEYYVLHQDEVFTEDPLKVTDDTLPELLYQSGEPVPPVIIPPIDSGSSGAIIVEYGDVHLSIVDGRQVYTAAALLGKSNYPIKATQMGPEAYFRLADITYDPAGSKFSILVDGFTLLPGEQLIIFPDLINPDI